MHIDPSTQGTLTVQAVAFSNIGLAVFLKAGSRKPGWYFVSISPYIDLFVTSYQIFSFTLWNDLLERSGLSNPAPAFQGVFFFGDYFLKLYCFSSRQQLFFFVLCLNYYCHQMFSHQNEESLIYAKVTLCRLLHPLEISMLVDTGNNNQCKEKDACRLCQTSATIFQALCLAGGTEEPLQWLLESQGSIVEVKENVHAEPMIQSTGTPAISLPLSSACASSAKLDAILLSWVVGSFQRCETCSVLLLLVRWWSWMKRMLAETK